MITTLLCFFILILTLILAGLLTYLVLLIRDQKDLHDDALEAAEQRHRELLQAIEHAGAPAGRKPLIKKPVKAPPPPPAAPEESHEPPAEHLGHMVADLQKHPSPPTPPPFISAGSKTAAVRYSTIPCPSCDYVHMINMAGEQKRYICPKCQQPIEIE